MRKFIDMSIRDASCFGSIAFLGVVFFALIIFQFYSLALQIAIAQIIVYIIAAPIKFFYKKKRPLERSFNNVIEEIDASSFPSIHAARITFLSLILAKFANNILFSVLLIIVVLVVFYSRIHVKDHDAKDVIGGFIAGLVAGILSIILL